MLQDNSIHANQFQFKNPIKRIELDAIRGEVLVLEDQNKNILIHRIETKNKNNTSQYTINLDPEKFHLQNAGNQFLFFSEIIDPTKTNDRAIKVFDLTRNEFVLSVKGKRFKGFIANDEIELESMEYLSLKKENVKLGNREGKIELIPIEGQYPELYYNQNEHFDSMKSFLEKELELVVEGPIEVLEYNELLILSVHCMENQMRAKNLVIINSEGLILFKKLMYQNLKKAIPDSFFVFNELLFFVSEFRTLNVIQLSFSNAN